MDNRFGKTLLAITTYNQLKYTKYCVDSIEKLNEVPFDLMIIDDCSTDGTVEWCKKNNIEVVDKHKPMGLTHSWNMAYKYFKDNKEYEYIIISNNDVLIPKEAISELLKVVNRWHFSVVVPTSTVYGAGHTEMYQGVENIYKSLSKELPKELLIDPNNFQTIQDQILNIKREAIKDNNICGLDPRRIKLFNGFFFLMTRKVIEYENEDNTLFDSTKPIYKAEDEFNWSKLIPRDDFAAVCRTSFIYHFKGISTENFSLENNTIDSFQQKRKEIDKING